MPVSSETTIFQFFSSRRTSSLCPHASRNGERNAMSSTTKQDLLSHQRSSIHPVLVHLISSLARTSPTWREIKKRHSRCCTASGKRKRLNWASPLADPKTNVVHVWPAASKISASVRSGEAMCYERPVAKSARSRIVSESQMLRRTLARINQYNLYLRRHSFCSSFMRVQSA